MKNLTIKSISKTNEFLSKYSRPFMILFMSISLIIVTSCGKYEEGPAFSLRTKTDRVENNWKIAQAIEDGKDVTADYDQYEMTLTGNNDATLAAIYTNFGVDYQFTTNGTWSFLAEKSKISFDYEGTDNDGIYTILKLEEDEMWLKQDDGKMEYHFVSK